MFHWARNWLWIRHYGVNLLLVNRGRLDTPGNGRLLSALIEWIASVTTVAFTDGFVIVSFAFSIHSAWARFTGRNASSTSATFMRATFIVAVTLRTTTGDGIRFGESSRDASADGSSNGVYWTLSIRSTWWWTAWIQGCSDCLTPLLILFLIRRGINTFSCRRISDKLSYSLITRKCVKCITKLVDIA